LIAFYIHNGYRSVGEHRMHNIRFAPLALQFPLSEGFKPRIVEEDLISFFKLFLFQSFICLHFHMLSTPSRLARLFGYFISPPRHRDRGSSL
jgi:hypothetical protein